MKLNTTISLIILFVVSISSFAQRENKQNKKEIIYFDENNNQISYGKSLVIRNKDYTFRYGDSLHHLVITPRKELGVIKNIKSFQNEIKKTVTDSIDFSKPLVIVYYQGKDPCNSSGSSTRKSTKYWYKQMEKKTRKIWDHTALYFYKDSTGLYGRHDGYKVWYRDPENILERLFFKKRYLCSSFTIISPKGFYNSTFGEFAQDEVVSSIEELKKIEFQEIEEH